MKQENENKNNGIQRYSVVRQRTSSLRVIPFEGIANKEHLVTIVNMSVGGVGIASHERIEPGLVCFDEQVGGHKFGVVRWCKKSENGYRAGIHFVTLPHEKETYLLDQVQLSRCSQALQDPEKIITSLLESIQSETNEI